MPRTPHHRRAWSSAIERVALGALPGAAMAFVALTRIGPTLFVFRWPRSSGLHLGDVVLLALVGPVWLVLLARTLPRRSRRAAPPGTMERLEPLP